MDKIIGKLNAFGCDTEGALERVVGDEPLYLDLLSEYILSVDLADLEALIATGDLKGAFEYAHSLKGAVGNMGITPLYLPISEITEILRKNSTENVAALLEKAKKVKSQFDEIMKENA